MRITGSLWRGFKGLDDRFRPLQGIVVMWVLFGILMLLSPEFRDNVRPWAVEPLEAPVLILLGLFVIDMVVQTVAWVRARRQNNG
ncbi:hypothetical protein [Sphingomonas sp. ID0503]|uniref:hypothetical protein n=1 Tax=Sphingomonas sp. ID0503 TaxID=3399691 RepID=UPI003AFA2C47